LKIICGNKEFCLSDILLLHLLKSSEGYPESKFYESALNSVCSNGVSELRKKKYLVFDQYDYEQESYFDKQGNERFIRKTNGKWIATSTDEPELSPLYLQEVDLKRYKFSVQPLLESIKKKNNLAKNINQINSRVWFVGEANVIQNNIGVFLVFIKEDKQAEDELLSLKAKVGKMDGIMVICPTFEVKAQDLLNKLESQNVKFLNFEEFFNKKDYVIDFSKINFAQVSGDQTPKLTDKQTSDYTKNAYQCYDVIHIPGTSPRKRSNDLNVNGHTIKMPDSAFKLFMEFVVELKKGKGGWLTKVVDAGKHQQFDRVRKPLEGSLLEKDAKKFIENNGSKQYRISTHPDFVTYDKSNLLKHADSEVKELAKKMPKK